MCINTGDASIQTSGNTHKKKTKILTISFFLNTKMAPNRKVNSQVKSKQNQKQKNKAQNEQDCKCTVVRH